jgi:Arc/MetJ-type ribon-helix-helix transcriptional regulator
MRLSAEDLSVIDAIAEHGGYGSRTDVVRRATQKWWVQIVVRNSKKRKPKKSSVAT